MELTNEDKELITEAKRVVNKFSDVKWKEQNISTVGSALRTKDGKIFSGPNIFHPDSGPTSICAEYSALAKAYSEGYQEIDAIVACSQNKILPPCGQCREFIRLFGDPFVILPKDAGAIKFKLSEIHLFPEEY